MRHGTQRKQRTLPATLAALLLAGCGSMLTPSYERPAVPVPERWSTQGVYQNAVRESDSDAIDMGWKTFVIDRSTA